MMVLRWIENALFLWRPCVWREAIFSVLYHKATSRRSDEFKAEFGRGLGMGREQGWTSLVTMSNEKNSSHLVFSIFICNYNILCMQYYFCFIIVHHINHIYHPLSHSLLHVLQAEALAAFSPKLSFKDVCLVNNFGG